MLRFLVWLVWGVVFAAIPPAFLLLAHGDPSAAALHEAGTLTWNGVLLRGDVLAYTCPVLGATVGEIALSGYRRRNQWHFLLGLAGTLWLVVAIILMGVEAASVSLLDPSQRIFFAKWIAISSLLLAALNMGLTERGGAGVPLQNPRSSA